MNSSLTKRWRHHHSTRVNRPQTRSIWFEPLEHRQLLAVDLVISEFVAANDTTLLDQDGDASDWMEVHNPTASVVSLNGWHLTDDEDTLALALALNDPATYERTYGIPPVLYGDTDGDGDLDFDDIAAFVAKLRNV